MRVFRPRKTRHRKRKRGGSSWGKRAKGEFLSEFEKVFAGFLDRFGVKYERERRIKNILSGRYIFCDFVLTDFHCVVELDGSQHLTEIGRARDWWREKYLTSICGMNVIRVLNRHVSLDTAREVIKIASLREKPAKVTFYRPSPTHGSQPAT